MTPREVVITALLGLGVLFLLLSSIGVLVMRTTYAKLHYLSPAGLFGAAFIAAAVCVRDGWSQSSVKVLLIVVLLMVSGPVLSHAIARTMWTRTEAGLDAEGESEEER